MITKRNLANTDAYNTVQGVAVKIGYDKHFSLSFYWNIAWTHSHLD